MGYGVLRTMSSNEPQLFHSRQEFMYLMLQSEEWYISQYIVY